MSDTPLYRSPRGKAYLDSTRDRLRARLAETSDSASRIAAYADRRRERFIETGLHGGQTGPLATYHLKDSARGICGAADLLVNGNGFPRTQVPRQAIKVLERALGDRYLEGVHGLECALVESDTPIAQMARFQVEREHFWNEIPDRMNAARIVNDRGQYPQVVADVIHMATLEHEALADWLEATAHAAKAHEVREYVALTRRELARLGTAEGDNRRNRRR